MAAPAAYFWKSDISSASEKAFLGFFGDFFVAELPQKKSCFDTQEFIRFLSTGVVTASSHVHWLVLSNKVFWAVATAWSLMSWHPTHTHLGVRLSLFSKLFALHRHNHAEWLGLGRYISSTVSVHSYSVTCSAASSCSSVSDTAVQPTGGEGAGSTPLRARRSRAPVHTACLIAATALPFIALLSSASSAAAARFAKTKTPRYQYWGIVTVPGSFLESGDLG